ncbi:DUF1289 domain-containing protein [Vibrio europaeus]|uniref:DUF1289 domain-containing protein n=1 Tax=Vibrio europaeus TaxID=300876 RepID=A0AAE7AW68_9VIBR|nr:DUF1289 domain-containing protein [Vibrio europaeus]MDC5806993.1 DUF1289 domain-containing protein [Vibrio europaeus]MDC5809588.1 DUF1289 domain-containing protein [Vibrio europaeus]MDC5827518.1 DUF1289 domain-containing protein [Vibrio europaeus]MDC5830362.1 DUF1289 domain-containing protein [Vibrio europaeus]MDC5837218.1 DUF1289 domain-containing protein [Vibrio europaeus]
MSRKSETQSTPSTPNPCIRHCCLDKDDICLGCYRSLDEILRWSQSTNEQKQSILDVCAQRKSERKGHWS